MFFKNILSFVYFVTIFIDWTNAARLGKFKFQFRKLNSNRKNLFKEAIELEKSQ